jgi:probable addiction module antidote protein
MPLKTLPWDSSEHLDCEEAISFYFEAILEESDPKLTIVGIGEIARALGMTEIAAKAGISRKSLYRALRRESGPDAATIRKLARAFGTGSTAKRIEKK